MVRENPGYKHADHLFRAIDPYARGKYDLTTRWLRPRVQRGQLLMNIGCGGGDYNHTAHALGLRVVACEPERAAYEALAVQSAPPACEIRHCGLLDLESEPADAIVMHDVLEHIEDDRAAVRRLYDLMRPGAIGVVSVPAYPWLFGHHDIALGHFRRYTRETLLAVLGELFEIEASRYYGAALIPVALWFSRLSKQPYPIAAASTGLAHRALGLVCDAESRVAMPLGTSVLARIRR